MLPVNAGEAAAPASLAGAAQEIALSTLAPLGASGALAVSEDSEAQTWT